MLTSEGGIAEQGSLEDLNAGDGYVKSLCLSNQTPVLSTIDQNESLESTDYVLGATTDKQGELVESASDNRRIGDTQVYLYYISSLGRFNTFLLLFFLSGFIICLTFPSKIYLSFLAHVRDLLTLNRYLGQVVGSCK